MIDITLTKAKYRQEPYKRVLPRDGEHATADRAGVPFTFLQVRKQWGANKQRNNSGEKQKEKQGMGHRRRQGLGFIGLAILIIFSSPAMAQDTCKAASVLTACVDAPSEGAIVAPSSTFEGWVYNAKTERHASNVMLWLTNEATLQTTHVPARIYWGPRGDVQAWAFLTGAFAPELALGFSIVPVFPLPQGTWQANVYITDLARDPDSINWVLLLRRRITVQ